MGNSLSDIAIELKNAQKTIRARDEKVKNIKAQLIYAFNGTGKTMLSNEFKSLVQPKIEGEETPLSEKKIIYYNAFTEDLFYWDNDLENDTSRKLSIHNNAFTKWVLEDQGQERNIITKFQEYTNSKLTPAFNERYINEDSTVVEANSEITFSFQRGNEDNPENIKISKGEESNFIWCFFYIFLEEVIETLNDEKENRSTADYDSLQYVFIDDPVTSLDDNYLISLAVDLGELIKKSKNPQLKFIITTHSPLFYNVLFNQLKKDQYEKYVLNKSEYGKYELKHQSSDSPFSYHLYLKKEIEDAIKAGQVRKYHFNFLRNILEKLSTFLGYKDWTDLPLENDEKINQYEKRIIHLFSHSKYSGEETVEIKKEEIEELDDLIKKINRSYHFKIS